MFQEMLAMSSGGGGSSATFSINEYNCYSTPATFQCTTALFTIGNYGDSSGVGCNYMGKLENGTVTPIADRGFYNVSYSSGTLTLAYSNTTDQANCYVKIMYI